MRVQPYLYFDGRCEEALEFYRKTLGAEVEMLMRFKDNPEPEGCGPGLPPGNDEKIMHASVRIGDTVVFVSDGMCQGKARFEGISLSLSVRTDEEAERIFAALGEGGEVQMPMMTTFFTSRFGMVADRFGVSWMVLVAE